MLFDLRMQTQLRSPNRVWWKQLLDVQRPYRRHIQGLELGFVLDIACGMGRNLFHLGGRGVGVDVDPSVVAICKAEGLIAYTPAEFQKSEYAVGKRFDTLLFSHVLEHMRYAEAEALVASYLPYLRDGGRVVFITPQEAGFKINDTHVELVDFSGLASITKSAGLKEVAHYSFPFPRIVGRWFPYNEFVAIAKKP